MQGSCPFQTLSLMFSMVSYKLKSLTDHESGKSDMLTVLVQKIRKCLKATHLESGGGQNLTFITGYPYFFPIMLNFYTFPSLETADFQLPTFSEFRHLNIIDLSKNPV